MKPTCPKVTNPTDECVVSIHVFLHLHVARNFTDMNPFQRNQKPRTVLLLTFLFT